MSQDNQDYQTVSRKVRALTQNITLLATLSEKDSKTYIIKGTTGSTYKVSISNLKECGCSCSCDDYIMRKQNCKHIYYVLMRILNVDPDTYFKNNESNNNLSITYKLVFENTVDNTFKFLDIYDSKNIVANITNYIEETYGIDAKWNAMKLFSGQIPVNEFTGIYFVKVNETLYELYKKTVTKTNIGWIFNDYICTIDDKKIGRFMLVAKKK